VTDGEGHAFEAHLAGLDPTDFRVELYADGIGGADPIRTEMTHAPGPVSRSDGCVYRTRASAARPAADYTVRLIPYCDGVEVPLDEPRVRWLR